MGKVKISPKQKKSLKDTVTQKKNAKKKTTTKPNLIHYDPMEEILDENFVGKAILECLINNDPEGVMEVIQIYLEALETAQFLKKSAVPKSTFYHSLKSKNPTIKTLAKLVHATTADVRKP